MIKNKTAMLIFFLSTNLSLLPAQKSDDEDEIILPIKSSQEESKISSEDVKKVLEETHNLAIDLSIHMDLLNANIDYNKKLMQAAHEIQNSNGIKFAWDILVSLDKNGENIDKLNILLKTGKININEESKIHDDFTSIKRAIYRSNYNLFEFLLKNGATLRYSDKMFLGDSLKMGIHLNNIERIRQLTKMLSLYYGV